MASSPSKSPGPITSVQPEIPPAAIDREIAAILASRAFKGSDALKRLLRYSVEHTRNGQGSDLKEYRVGVEAFGRDASFDPRVDPVVRMTAHRLRAKLADYYAGEGRQDDLRIDIPKGGYAATFMLKAPAVAAPFVQTTGNRARHAVVYTFVAVLAISGIAVFIARAIMQRRQHAGSPIHSIAVLPFQNLSGDSSQDYLADGITENLVTELAQIHALRVISRTSAFTYKGSNKKLAEIARELNVDAVVEGSVARSGDGVRITAQLISAPNDTHLWAQSYLSDMHDLLTVQSRVAQAIVAQVGVTMTPQETHRIQTVRLVDPLAHETYLLGRYYWNQRTPASIMTSLGLFEKAIRIDPNSAEAYAAIASAYIALFAGDNFPPREQLMKARAAAEKAISLDDSLAEPHAVLGLVNVAENYDWEGSDREFRKAFERDPNYATAHHWYGYTLMFRGHAADAYRELQEALRLDPLNPVIMVAMDGPLVAMGKDQEALQQVRKELAIDPHFYYALWGMGDLYINMGQYEEAVSAYQQALTVVPNDPAVLSRLCFALGRQGRRSEALKTFHLLKQLRKGKYFSGGLEAWVYAGLGDTPHALDALERAYRDRSITVLMLRSHFFDSLRSQPRFKTIADATGLFTERAR